MVTPAITRSANQFDDPTVPLTAKAVDRGNALFQLFKDFAVLARIAELEASGAVTLDDVEALLDRDGAAIPFTIGTYAGRPQAGGALTIEANGITRVYEFVAAAEDIADPDNVAVVKASSEDTDWAVLVALVNSATWQAGNEQNLLAVHVTGTNKVYFYPADAPGGTPVVGASEITFTDAVDNFTLLRTTLDDTPGAVVPLTKHAVFPIPVTTAMLALAQPVQVPLKGGEAPRYWQAQVRDANGRLKVFADLKIAVGTAVGDQEFLELSMNQAALGDAGLPTEDTVITLSASGTHWGYFSAGKRKKKVLQTEATWKAALGGATVATFSATKTTAAGAETALATTVDIAAQAAHDPTTITYNTVPLPATLDEGDKVAYGIAIGSGLTGPLDITVTTHFVELLENGDTIHLHVAW